MKKSKAIGPIVMSIFFFLILYIVFVDKYDYCSDYYELFKLDYTGIVTRKWHNKGTVMNVDFIDKNGGVQLRDAASPELVDNAVVDDTIIKKAGTMLCTLKTKKGMMILPYEYLPPGVHCPDTNKLK